MTTCNGGGSREDLSPLALSGKQWRHECMCDRKQGGTDREGEAGRGREERRLGGEGNEKEASLGVQRITVGLIMSWSNLRTHRVQNRP